MTLFELFLVLLFLGLSAFLSLSETSLVGMSKLRLRHMVDRGLKGAKVTQGLVTQMDQVITTILVWSCFVNAALTGLVAAACIVWLGEGRGVTAATFLAGSMILLVADILPKVYAVRYADQVSLWVAPAIAHVVRLFRPVSFWITHLTQAAFKLVGVSMPARSPLVTEEELKLMIELGKEEGVLGEHERMMLHRIFEFGDMKVRDIMIPRDQMVAVQEGATHDEILQVLTEEGHSRIPVYRDSKDQITGVIYAQEILHILREGWLIVLQDIIHPPFEVTPDMRVAELLQEFQRRKLQIAVVVDGQGRALGMATLEDLIEEIVGEIQEKQAP